MGFEHKCLVLKSWSCKIHQRRAILEPLQLLKYYYIVYVNSTKSISAKDQKNRSAKRVSVKDYRVHKSNRTL